MTETEWIKSTWGAYSRVMIDKVVFAVLGIDWGEGKILVDLSGRDWWVSFRKCERIVDANHDLPR